MGRTAVELRSHASGPKLVSRQPGRAVVIGATTFVMLIAATVIADKTYPPCTPQRTDNCSAQQQGPGPTLYIPCPKGQYCPPHDLPRPKRQQ